MSQEQLKAFIEKVNEDKELQDKLAELPKDDINAAQKAGIAIAQEAGFCVEIEDFEPNGKGEMSDEDLEKVAGGTIVKTFNVWLCN